MDSKIQVKISNYCVYQERTQDEVRKKLAELKVFGHDAEEMISWLITENFINEERFAKAFAGGKFRIKKWGKRKIVYELKARKLSDYCIKSGLKEINESEYLTTIELLIKKKKHELATETNLLITKQKTLKYLISKGFEADLVLDFLK